MLPAIKSLLSKKTKDNGFGNGLNYFLKNIEIEYL